MQEVWNTLIDFIAAYNHGFVDGQRRHFYPRLFTYSADYPEKVLLASVRDKGVCPCPRCLVRKADIHKLGQKIDSRNRLSKTRQYVGHIIKSASLHLYARTQNEWRCCGETAFFGQNTFAEKLGPLGLNRYVMLVLHDFELGKVFILRSFLNTVDDKDRFRLIPPFGRSIIRRFCSDASQTSKLAARYYEDLLQACNVHIIFVRWLTNYVQCVIPVFDELLPEPHNEVVMALLFRLAEWHALAKLRLDTDSTLSLMESVTTVLGQELRRFVKDTCSRFKTTELPKECAARGRRQSRKEAQNTEAASNTALKTSAAEKRPKTLNLSVYKIHALGDYVNTNRLFGTTDLFSSQIGELEHRRVKRFHIRTSKNNPLPQMTRLERRETQLLCRRRTAQNTDAEAHSHHVGFSENDPLPYTDANMPHHHMSESRTWHYQDAYRLRTLFPNDPASKAC
ncbi:hypothetical protein PILCRDRAFT_12697 [Piloderma croceum F 1598]|uniref:Uncharacterized protein n=1 Tax=Piloderma croceum (strain F 1598) TaxID=765440 RepID=A0A0C3F918_PILCF|nr:hypothetical protein PILCRDRAFT_12697 [Piloderma croceum F 1598]